MLYRYCINNWLNNSLDLISHIFLEYVLVKTIIVMDIFDPEQSV